MSYEIKFLKQEVNELKKELADFKKLLNNVLELKENSVEQYYSIQQVAEKLNVSDRSVRRMIDNQELLVITRSGSSSGTKKTIRIPASSLTKWAKQNQASVN